MKAPRSPRLRWRSELPELLAAIAGLEAAGWLYEVALRGMPFHWWLSQSAVGECASAIALWLVALRWGAAASGPRVFAQRFLSACGAVFIVQSATLYFLQIDPHPPAIILGSTAVAMAAMAATRRWLAPARPRAAATVLFVGFDRIAEALARSMGTAVLGILHPDPAAVPADLPYLGDLSRLPEVAASGRPARIIVSGTGDSFPVSPRLLHRLWLSGIAVDNGLASYEDSFGRVCWPRMGPSTLLFSPSLTTHRFVMSLQAIYTDLAGLAVLLAALPLLAAAAGAALFSRGPVLERVECTGFLGVPFQMLRFRTTDGSGRRTWIGRALMRLRAVKLPQLINVVRGEMAFIGPPPVRTEFSARLAALLPFYPARFTVRPGILGWSQAHLAGWNGVPDESLRLEYDLYYVQEIVPALDFEILIRSLSPAPFRKPRQVRARA